jgi:predicted aspartyl protease
MMEKIAKHYTYSEFVGKGSKNGGDLFTRSQTENPEAYKDMLNCVLEHMGKPSNNNGGKKENTQSVSSTSPATETNGDFMEKFFVDACVQAASKTKEYKQMNVDVNTYCQCTWDKIEEKGLSMDKLGDLSDPNSPLFNEIITPCIMSSIKTKNEETQGSTTFLRNPDDIKGPNNSETVSLTKLMNVYKLKVSFGSIEKYFTLDSGANDVFITSDFERDLLLEGLIKKSDYLSARLYRMADGSQVECRRLKLNNIKIGGFAINNVIVAITEKSNGMLLLGKSLLDKFSDWKIDNQKEQLILTR